MINDQIDSLCYEIHEVVRQVQDGCIAYNNAIVISQYYDKYGYTEHFRTLVGSENLVDQAKDVIRRFVKWVKQKLTELIEKISNLFLLLRRRLAKLFGLQKTPTDLLSMQKQIDSKLSLASKFMSDTVSTRFDTRRICNTTKEAITFITEGPSNNTVDQYTKGTNDCLNKVEESCKELSHFSSIQRTVVSDQARFVSSITGSLAVRADSLLIDLKEFKETISGDMTREEFLEAVKEFTKSSPKTFNSSVFDKELDQMIQEVTKIVATMTTSSGRLMNITYNYLSKLNKEINSDAPVRVVVGINPQMLRRLEHQFGGSLNIRNIIITNEDPHTWEIANDTPDERPACGWCYANGHNSGALDLYINYRLYKRRLKTKRYDDFILTIVHECFHLFRSQHGSSTTSEEHEEDLARTEEIEYGVPKADDIAWVQSVMKKINEQDSD